jgi:hypothetical protein
VAQTETRRKGEEEEKYTHSKFDSGSSLRRRKQKYADGLIGQELEVSRRESEGKRSLGARTESRRHQEREGCWFGKEC